LDSTGNSHIAYIGENGSLKYASWTGTYWNIQTIDSKPNIPQFETDFHCLALDSDDRAIVVYCVGYGSDSTIKWAMEDSSEWTIRTVITDPNATSLGNVVVDSRGYPRFTYNCDWNHSLMYERWNGITWIGQTATIISQDYYTGFLRLDSNDNPHLTYLLQKASLDVKYARWKLSGWDVQTVAGAFALGYPPPLALDSKGNPNICYMVIRDQHGSFLVGGTVMYATSNQPLQTVPLEFLLLMFALLLAVGLLIAFDYYRERLT
jgi:hypothetical protein